MTMRAEALEAWNQWDERPKDERTAQVWTDTTKALGLPYGLPHMCVQDVLVTFRRAGIPRGVCLDAFIAAAQLIRERTP